MKSFVLMNRKTGDLFEGHRVCLMDVSTHEVLATSYGWSLAATRDRPDGWLVYSSHASFAGFRIWFNGESVAKFFIVLGEL